MMMWRGCELEERGGGEIIYANWILRQSTVGAVQCFWRVSEVVSEQSVEDYDCRSVSEVSGFRELPGVPDWAQDIRIIQEFQGDLIRTVTWTVRISVTVSSRNAGHTRGNSAD